MSLHPENKYFYALEIAGISFQIHTFMDLQESDAFLPFYKDTENPDFHINFELVDHLSEVKGQVLHEDECYRVHLDSNGETVRSFFDAPRDFEPYARVRNEIQNHQIQIECLSKGEHCISEMHNSFFHIGFESLLIHKNRLCLHASCVKTPFGSILFSGPSGIGKSTQAKLWCTSRDAYEINGDRPILSKSDSGWLAWGSPYAGSSRVHLNESCPVKAIVMLKQGSSCQIRKLTCTEAFRAIWSGLTIYTWDKRFVEKASELAIELITQVNVYELCCTPDENAVECLENQLRKEECLWVNKRQVDDH